LLNADGAVCADGAQIIGLSAGRSDRNGVWPAVANGRTRDLLAAPEGAVRFEKPSPYSAELPLGAAKGSRLVRRPVSFGDARLAGAFALQPIRPDFALRAASVPPANVFVPRDALAEVAGVPGMANLLVSPREPETFARDLARALTPEDAGLVLEDGSQATVGNRQLAVGDAQSSVASSETIIKSRRVFLPRAVMGTLEKAGLKVSPATFHLADAFEAGAKSTPYGFVAAVTPGGGEVPSDLSDDEVVINAWLAETLDVKAGDVLTLRWRRFEAGGRLVSDARPFRVREVIPTERAAQAKRLMPVFPGLAGVDSCTAWDVGLPMDETKLKDADNEAYWKRWRETPKAFLTLTAGRACFGTVFGEAMSVRVAADAKTVRGALKGLTPGEIGLAVRPVWREGESAAQGSTDFRTLFLGMAFVLIVSALLLSSLSLSLALETRSGEWALLGALGLGRRLAVRLAVAEWGVPLALGALAGAGLGAGLARSLVWGLSRFWRGAFGGAGVAFHFSFPVAAVAACAAAFLTLLVALRAIGRCASVPPVELWQAAGNWRLETGAAALRAGGRGLFWRSVMGGALAVAALGLMAWNPSGGAANGVFFGAGFLLMLSLLLFLGTSGAAWASRTGGAYLFGPVRAGVCRALVSPHRSAPVVVLLAVGTFLTIGILSMKNDPAKGCELASSGSGGFASLVTSVLPLDRARGLELARRASWPDGEAAEKAREERAVEGIVPVRVHEGDEAGCLNMARPATPRLLGLDARTMARGRAFEPENAGGVWTPIESPLPDGTIPALAADQTMVEYSLKAKTGIADGAVFMYTGAGGRTWRVRLVGALPVRSGILEGALIVDEAQFVRMFPDEGYRLWLCDHAPKSLREAEDGGRRTEDGGRRTEDGGRKTEVGGRKTEDGEQRTDGKNPISSVAALRHPEPGVTVETVGNRLRLLGAVESTYLDLFLVLGGLGVVLGVFGIALVILRGVEERRGELALLGAVGLSRRLVVRSLAAEYGVLVAAGLGCGVVPALVAIQPAAQALHGALPWAAMAGVLAAMALCAAACVAAAAGAATRRFDADALKEEV